MNFKDALYSLRPTAKYIVKGEDDVEWLDEIQKQPTNEEIEAEIARLKADYINKEYQRNRQFAYKSIEEQLDMQYWDKINGTNHWQEHIDAVKAAYPKPTE